MMGTNEMPPPGRDGARGAFVLPNKKHRRVAVLTAVERPLAHNRATTTSALLLLPSRASQRVQKRQHHRDDIGCGGAWIQRGASRCTSVCG